MNSDEKKGYARGYAAGKKRKERLIIEERRRTQDQAFLDRAFLAALTACIDVQGWRTGDKPISNIPERVKLAADFARAALLQRPMP